MSWFAIKIFSFLGGIWMISMPVWMHNAWRALNPVRIETSAQAKEYGNAMLKKYFPHADLGEKHTSYPYVDYRYYVLVEPRDVGEAWIVGHDPVHLVGEEYLGWGGPSVKIYKNTGQIHLGSWTK